MDFDTNNHSVFMLGHKITCYEATGKMLTTIPAQYKKEYPYLKEVDALALANVQLNLQSAYKNFFHDKKIGFPNYKSAKHNRKPYTTNNQKGTVAVIDKGIRLPKIGKVKAPIRKTNCRKGIEAGQTTFAGISWTLGQFVPKLFSY